MLRTVFLKTLRDQRRGLLGWSIGILGLILVEGALWPSVRDMPDVEKFLNSYPEPLKELFDMDAMTTGTGFLNAELYTLVLPLLFLVFGISRGARLLAGEEEAGSLDVLLTTPLSATRVLLEKAAAVLIALVVLGGVTVTATLVASALFGMGVTVGQALVGALAMVLLGTEFGLLALAVGAATGQRVVALALPAVAAVAAYVLYVGGTMVDDLEPALPWSPFHQAIADGPLEAALPASFVWLVVGTLVVLAVALPMFARRDIGAH